MTYPFPPQVRARIAERRAALRDEHLQSDDYLARACAAVPLNAREMIPDATLRRLMKGEPEALQGEISAELQLELVTLLPDLCGELLARRLVEDAVELRRARR